MTARLPRLPRRVTPSLSCRALLLGSLLALPLAPLAIVPAAQAAGSTTGSLGVSATVLDNCTIAAVPLAFGNYSSAANKDATATITVNCSTGTAYTVALDLGLGTGAVLASRKMQGPQAGDLLGYQIFSDTGRTTLWGSTVGVNTVGGTGTGVDQPITVYGRVTAGQAVRAGAYTDTVGIVVAY
jgi:spore coat protein U-like protein